MLLFHAIRDVNPEAVDAGAKVKERVLEVQSKCVVQFMHYNFPWVSLILGGFSEQCVL